MRAYRVHHQRAVRSQNCGVSDKPPVGPLRPVGPNRKPAASASQHFECGLKPSTNYIYSHTLTHTVPTLFVSSFVLCGSLSAAHLWCEQFSSNFHEFVTLFCSFFNFSHKKHLQTFINWCKTRFMYEIRKITRKRCIFRSKFCAFSMDYSPQ